MTGQTNSISTQRLHEGMRARHEADIDYVERWMTETVFWLTQGVYDEVVKFIGPLGDRGFHIDLGSGVGLLANRIAYHSSPTATVLGVDRNPHMLPHGNGLYTELEGITNKNVPLSIYHGEMMQALPDGEIRSVHVPFKVINGDPVMCSSWLGTDAEAQLQVGVTTLSEDAYYPCQDLDLSRPGVSLLTDDLTDGKLTRYFLGNKKADSVSIMFPGDSNRLLIGTGLVEHTDAARSSHMRGGEDTSRSSLGLATNTLKPGGKLVTVTRMPKHMLANREAVRRTLHSFADSTVEDMPDRTAFEELVSFSLVHRTFQNPAREKISWRYQNLEGKVEEFFEASIAMIAHTRR